MRAIAGSILILAAVQYHLSPAASRPLGVCLLWIIALTGVGYLVSDLAGLRRSDNARALLSRWLGWSLRGGNFLIKGTVVGAFAGLLANLLFMGGTRIGNLAAMPGAFVGLMLGVVIDAVAHRYRNRRPIDPALPAEAANPLADDERRPLVESHGWDLSTGVSHTVPDWPGGANPIERR